MRVLFFGNICNYAYWFAKWSRSIGVDAHALIESDEPIFRPEREDPSFDPRNPPSWVHYYRAGSDNDVIKHHVPDPSVHAVLREFDSVQTFSVTTAIAAAAVDVDFIHHCVGSFAVTSKWSGEGRFRSRISPSRIALTRAFRMAMDRTSCIVVSTPIEFQDVTASPFRSKLVPLPVPYDVIDAERFIDRSPRPGPKDRVTFLMPSRHDWDLKGQDIVFEAMSMQSPSNWQRMHVEAMTWGRDLDRSRALVERLGLTANISWRPMATRTELWTECSRARTVVVGEFYRRKPIGGIGGVMRDAMATSSPVISDLDVKASSLIHEIDPPIIIARSNVSEVGAAIDRVLNADLGCLDDIGKAGHDWLVQECQFTNVIPRFLELHTRLVSKTHDVLART